MTSSRIMEGRIFCSIMVRERRRSWSFSRCSISRWVDCVLLSVSVMVSFADGGRQWCSSSFTRIMRGEHVALCLVRAFFWHWELQ